MLRRLSFALLVVITSASVVLACGTERWAVKTGADQDVGDVDLTPTESSIAELSDLHAPPKPNTRATTRFRPTEFQTFRIKGILVGIKKEADADYHIVIQAPDDPEGTMVIESVSPDCTKKSLFTGQIIDVRAAIDEKIKKIGGKLKPINIPVTVVGVGFFDPIHGQTGVAPNGIELHPILDIQFE